MGLILSGLLFLAIGIAGSYFVTRNSSGFWNHKWPAVTGRIIENNARLFMDNEESESEPDNFPSCELRYEYTIHGTVHTSSTVAVNSFPYEYDELETLFPVGAVAKVFYNPSDVAQSCLKTRDVGDSIGNLFVTSVFICIGIGVITAGIL